MIYADKIDHIVENDKAVKSCISIINKTFQKWNLRCNLSKTEITNLERSKDESWRLRKKLCTLLGDDEDRHSLLSRLESYQAYGKKLKKCQKEKKNLYKALVLYSHITGKYVLSKQNLGNSQKTNKKTNGNYLS